MPNSATISRPYVNSSWIVLSKVPCGFNCSLPLTITPGGEPAQRKQQNHRDYSRSCCLHTQYPFSLCP